ncbi:hypothetical protein FHS85_001965 [Rhodoligotrophos appendicifer]
MSNGDTEDDGTEASGGKKLSQPGQPLGYEWSRGPVEPEVDEEDAKDEDEEARRLLENIPEWKEKNEKLRADYRQYSHRFMRLLRQRSAGSRARATRPVAKQRKTRSWTRPALKPRPFTSA